MRATIFAGKIATNGEDIRVRRAGAVLDEQVGRVKRSKRAFLNLSSNRAVNIACCPNRAANTRGIRTGKVNPILIVLIEPIVLKPWKNSDNMISHKSTVEFFTKAQVKKKQQIYALKKKKKSLAAGHF